MSLKVVLIVTHYVEIYCTNTEGSFNTKLIKCTDTVDRVFRVLFKSKENTYK